MIVNELNKNTLEVFDTSKFVLLETGQNSKSFEKIFCCHN